MVECTPSGMSAKVTALSVGECLIIVGTRDGGHTAMCTVVATAKFAPDAGCSVGLCPGGWKCYHNPAAPVASSMRKRVIFNLVSDSGKVHEVAVSAGGSAVARRGRSLCGRGHGTGEHVDGEVLVLLEIPPNAASASGSACEAALLSSAQSVAESIGARAVRAYPAIAVATGRNTVLMKGEGKSTQELLAALDGRPGVLGASPNYIFHATATPDDPRYGEMWGMPFIEAPGAWDTATGSRDIVVAVVDTGIKRDHADLAANVVRDVDGEWGIDTINNDRDPADDQGHGTHVAGTIGAAGNNALGVTGVNWTVGLLGVKVLGATAAARLARS